MFANVKFGHALSANCNFRDFPSSMLLLIRVMTGANFQVIMHDLGVGPPYCTAEKTNFDGTALKGHCWAPNDCGSAWFATVYFVSFYVFGVWAVLNLFFVVILDNFAFCASADDAQISATTLAVFREEWFKPWAKMTWHDTMAGTWPCTVYFKAGTWPCTESCRTTTGS